MNDIAARMRRAAQGALPEGAFLRRDREKALYVTDAVMREGERHEVYWRQSVWEAGFSSHPRGKLVALMPRRLWLQRLEAAFPEPPDGLCASLMRFAGGLPDEASLSLFVNGVKLLEGGGNTGAFDRQIRQRAAVCLRTGAPGGGLYACALLLSLLKSTDDSRLAL